MKKPDNTSSDFWRRGIALAKRLTPSELSEHRLDREKDIQGIESRDQLKERSRGKNLNSLRK